MSKVVTMRLADEQAEALQRLARRMDRSQGETAARLVDEALRMAEYAFITFRSSIVGRQAYIQGRGLAVWEVIMLLRERSGDVAATAAYLQWPLAQVQAAVNYARAFPDDIADALADNDSYSAEKVSAMLPQTRVVDL